MKEEKIYTLENNLTHETSLPEIVLPALQFDMIEQFALALQNRDENALVFLLGDKDYCSELINKQKFITNYLTYCKWLENKYGAIYVRTNNGACDDVKCNKGTVGLAVTVHALVNNKQLWNFNIIAECDKTSGLDLCKCYKFKLNKTDI